MKHKWFGEKQQIMILGMITIILFVLLMMVAYRFKIEEKKEQTQRPEVEETIPIEEKDDLLEEKSEEFVPEATVSPVPSPNLSPNPILESTPTENSEKPESSLTQDPVIKSEEDVIQYFERIDTNFVVEKKDDVTLLEQAKDGFTHVVDFLFYDAEIAGYRFSELTQKAKLKVLSIALRIDSKIDQYFPSYKDTVKEKYHNLKGKAAALYLETTAKLCETVGDSACAEARADFKKMKESFGLTWNLLKEGATSAKDLLKEWYQSIKD